MVRVPLTPEQIAAGRRLGALLRDARGEQRLDDIAGAAGISPETLRKIESGRLVTPSFFTVAALADVLAIPLGNLAAARAVDAEFGRAG
ncbi:helix-turn-helix domain-containing protein [Gordonia sp. CPCC 205333]|uniref:helix-turn-helix domain-containing protein n=1 Tax=Gordonia sp. CPCC 205333 TaxID=3140790 RepID=UPI003AF3E80E